MNHTQSIYFCVDRVLYLPSPCDECDEEERVLGRKRLYSLEIIKEAPLVLLFGLLADEVKDLFFTKHQIMKLVENERSWFERGMRTHLFLGGKTEVFSARFGEDRIFHFEEHNFFRLSEMRSGKMGHHLYVPDYLIG